MKFQIIFAAIFAFAAVSSRKGCFFGHNTDNYQVANLYNSARSDGAALAINNSCFGGSANAAVCSKATNVNCVDQDQRNYWLIKLIYSS